MATWITPKTDWTEEDALNYKDYNRIKNNLAYLHEQVCNEWGNFEIEDMGEDIDSVAEKYDAKYFNAFESNVDIINKNMFSQNYGFRKTFYYNGAFISPEELNRIEGATLRMKQIVDGKIAGKIRLPFRFGALRNLKIQRK